MSLTCRITRPHDGSTVLNPFVWVKVTETGDGALRFDLKVDGEKGLTADLRGLFFHIADERLAASLSAKGELDGGAGSDRIYVGGGNDTTQGGDGDDLIKSGDGNDIAMGGAGNDEIQGEGGDDVIIGGRDNGAINGNSLVIGDNLYGNDGRDTFVFQKGDGVDLIWDFQAGIDSLVIKGYDFDAGALRFVNQVTNDGHDGAHPLDAHGHQKLALVMDAGGDAIVFNDPGNRADSAGSVRFDDV
ncbi:MAG: hypothetical protein NTW56_08410, partial [Alphaproteobacteria bacterium]|nr:hypothetical protein [Alphaproteobacteria bacterium]